ncbi:MAG: dephospho-CoA kinase [Acidobacteria bacterium]|nr:dephospho-CoA kinase [Acidobacteriota bacterium]
MPDSGKYFGLTGGIASGKSTVAAAFSELGARIIDADKIGHELLHSTSPAFPEIVSAFGPGILDPSGEIDRRRLGPLVFANPARLRQLSAILHPRIIDRVEQSALEYCAQDPAAVVIVDAALVYEAGIGGRFRKMIVAWCRPEQQIERLIAKAGITREEAEKRIASQIPAEEKRRRADFVIDCSGSIEETQRQVEALYPRLRKLAETAWPRH